MKKSLIAVAVAAALPAAAFAQSNVTMYGIADVSLEFSDKNINASGKSDIRMNDGVQSSSRWGIRGEEDLGGGLAATFVFEAGLDFDNGAAESVFFGRQARVGLKGGFGEIRLGRQYTPVFYSAIETDFAGNGWYFNHYAPAGSAGRFDNMVEYRNKFGGFEIIGAWAPGEDRSVVVPGVGGAPAITNYLAGDDVFGIAGIYNGGVWGMSASYQDEGVQTVAQLGAKVMFGPARFGVSGTVATPDVGTGDRTDIDLSVALKLGASGYSVLNVALIDNNPTGNNSIKSTEVGLSYGHAMSKRTNWYVSVGLLDPDVGDLGAKAAVGIRHRF